jgi:molybdate/tungstate transport system substrate-binding protein
VSLPAPFDIKAQYTVALLQGAPNPAGAERFVQFLLGAQGQAILRAAGLQVIAPARLNGDAAQLPASLKPLLHTTQ